MSFTVDTAGFERTIADFMRKSPNRARWANAEALKITGGHIRKRLRAYIERGGRGWPPIVREMAPLGRRTNSPLHFMGRMIRFRYGTRQGVQRVQIGFFPTRKINFRTRYRLSRANKKQTYSMRDVKSQRQAFRRSFRMTHESFARFHEYGKRRRVTEKARGYFAAMGTPLKKSTKFIDNPARPSVGPVHRKLKAAIPAYYRKKFFKKFFSRQKPKLRV